MKRYAFFGHRPPVYPIDVGQDQGSMFQRLCSAATAPQGGITLALCLLEYFTPRSVRSVLARCFPFRGYAPHCSPTSLASLAFVMILACVMVLT